MLTMLSSLCLISFKQTVSSNHLMPLLIHDNFKLGLKLSWPKTKLQNVGAGDLPSTILIDGVQVEAVEEFIFLDSKQSSNGYCRPDVLCRIGLACSVMSSLQRVWKCSSLSINTKVNVPSIGNVCTALWCKNIGAQLAKIISQ